MEQKDQVEIIKLKIKNEKEYLKELIELKEKARKEFEECLAENYSSKLTVYKSAILNVSRQYLRLSTIIEVAFALDLISSIEFAKLSSEISGLVF